MLGLYKEAWVYSHYRQVMLFGAAALSTESGHSANPGTCRYFIISTSFCLSVLFACWSLTPAPPLPLRPSLLVNSHQSLNVYLGCPVLDTGVFETSLTCPLSSMVAVYKGNGNTEKSNIKAEGSAHGKHTPQARSASTTNTGDQGNLSKSESYLSLVRKLEVQDQGSSIWPW